MSNVSVGFQANPSSVLDAYRRIEEAARRANKELRSMQDINFPGLEDARQELESINRGFTQMFSRAVRGGTAEALRSGAKSGLYTPDLVSWMQNAHRQFPDEAAFQRHMQGVLRQSGNLANMGALPNFGGGGGAAPTGGGFGGFVPMARSMLGMLGIGTGLAYAGKLVGGATNEAIGMSDLRRQIGGLDQDFESFRDTIRKSSDAMGVGVEETIRLNREYAKLSGAMTGDASSAGSREGMRLARMFGLDAGQGVGMTGRSAWLQVGGSGAKEQARFLAEAMAASNLGGRQAEAADAMLRFAERSASVLGGAGNMEGFRGLYSALINSGLPGIRSNAENILGGYDSAVRSGGRAGDAGKNFIYRMLSQNGISDPFKVQMALEGGFTGSLGGGRMIGPELIKSIRRQYGGNREMMLSAMSGLFGGSMTHAAGALDAFDKYKEDPAALQARLKELDLGNQDPGIKARIEANELEKEMTKTMQGMVPALNDLKEHITDLARGVNHIASFLPGWDKIKATVGDINPQLPGPAGVFWGAKNAIGAIGAMWGRLRGNGVFGDTDFMKDLESQSRQYGIDPEVVRQLMWAESRGNPGAVSSTGAVGLFQLTKGAAKDSGITDLQRYSPVHNMQAGVKYLAQLRDRYGGDIEEALAAYNNGPGNIDRGNYKITLPNGGVQDAEKFARSIMVQVEVVHKNEAGKVLKRETKSGGRIAIPATAGAH